MSKNQATSPTNAGQRIPTSRRIHKAQALKKEPILEKYTMGLVTSPPRITPRVPDFDIGVDPVTGWTQFPKNLHYHFDRYPRRKLPSLPYRFTVCLALNEAGRRAKRGVVAWTGGIGQAETRGPGLYYVGQEWSEVSFSIFV